MSKTMITFLLAQSCTEKLTEKADELE